MLTGLNPEGSTDLVLLLPWPPDEAAEPPAHQLPKYIWALTDAGGQLESLCSEKSHRVMDQMSLSMAHTSEGKTPVREAHGQPPDFSNLQTQGSTA